MALFICIFRFYRISRYQVKLRVIMWPDLFCLVVFSSIGHHAFASANCPPNEYRVGIECCPSCPPGKNHISELLLNIRINKIIGSKKYKLISMKQSQITYSTFPFQQDGMF